MTSSLLGRFRGTALGCFLVVTLAACDSVEAQTRPFTAEDMLNVVQISGDVSVSPDGAVTAFVLPDVEDDWNVLARRPLGSVHLLDLSVGDGVPVPIEGTPHRTSFPVFSPDGSRLALFVESPEGNRLAVWDREARRLELLGAPFEGEVTSAPQWATDGRIVYARPAPEPPPEEPPRVSVLEITDPLPGDDYFRRDRRAGLRVVDVASGAEQILVPDGGTVRGFDVATDGARVLGRLADRRRSLLWNLDGGARDGGRGVAEIGAPGDALQWMADGRLVAQQSGAVVVFDPARPAASGEPLVRLDEALAGISPSPSGRHVAGLRVDPSIADPEIEPPQPGMYTIARPFFDLVVVSVENGNAANVTDDIADQIRSVTWSHDGASVYFVATDNESYDETLFRYDVDSERRVVVDAGRKSFGALTPLANGVMASVESATAPADLWVYRGGSGSAARVTELNRWLTDFDFSEPELFHFDDSEGDRLGALLFRATGPIPGDGEPVITYVYEKLTPSIHRFQPRHQIFVTHGYAVLMPNVLVKVGETGTSFVRSTVAATEAVHAMGFTNGRSCLWGGSFGAYAASYVITQTNLFDCAVSRATPPELFRNWASGRDRDSDNIERGQARMGGSPFEVQERYLSQSAFFHLDQVETPVLITHGMKDYTILYEEGAMMFYALRRLGKEATMVTYRDGDHSLYRHSRADALDVHRRMLEWFARYLRPGEGSR